MSLLFPVISAGTAMPDEEREAHSLIANVAGRVMMLQKDKPAAERSSKKVILSPVLFFILLRMPFFSRDFLMKFLLLC